MEASDKGQVSGSAADVYETFFVPALFGAWAAPVLDRAAPPKGGALLDLACGTGLLARTAQQRMGPGAKITGLDRNPGMLAVAKREAPDIDWREGMAERLPFADASFDAVVSNFGLMFFEDRNAALEEVYRVLRPDGRMVIAVWGSLEETPGYAAMVALLERLFGREIADALRAPYNLGDRATLMELAVAAELPSAEIETLAGEACFPSLDAWVHTDVKGWTLADMIDEAQFQTLKQEAATALAEFVRSDGTVRFAAPAHLLTLTK
ncbi:MAG: methyltransferase domain-containing protein [Kiloniellales bacterium]